MDEFRKHFFERFVRSGCPCCQGPGTQKSFKKKTRKITRKRLKNKDEKQSQSI
jgi:hypothetical protein